jgi:hypothetical protein
MLEAYSNGLGVHHRFEFWRKYGGMVAAARKTMPQHGRDDTLQLHNFAEFFFHDVREYAVRSLPSTVKEVLSVEPDPHGKPSWRVEGG